MLRSAGQAWVLADTAKVGAGRFPYWTPLDRRCHLLVDEDGVSPDQVPETCSLWTADQARSAADATA